MSADETPGAVLVLGATSAIARALAGEYAREGRDLVLAGRDMEELALVARDLEVRFGVRAEALPFSARDLDSHEEFFDACLDAARGRLDGAALCFGSMAEQADAQRDFEIARQTIEVTYTGAVSLLHRLANYLEGRGAGFLVVIGSVAGDRGRQSNYVYGSAKAALATYTQGLRVRLFKSGVNVTLVKPGFIDTKMTFGRPGLFLVASPEAAARSIHRAARRGKAEVYVPGFWWGIMTIIKAVPDLIFKRMKM